MSEQDAALVETRNRLAIFAAIRAGCRTPEEIAAFDQSEEGSGLNLNVPLVRDLLWRMQQDGSVSVISETWEIVRDW